MRGQLRPHALGVIAYGPLKPVKAITKAIDAEVPSRPDGPSSLTDPVAGAIWYVFAHQTVTRYFRGRR